MLKMFPRLAQILFKAWGRRLRISPILHPLSLGGTWIATVSRNYHPIHTRQHWLVPTNWRPVIPGERAGRERVGAAIARAGPFWNSGAGSGWGNSVRFFGAQRLQRAGRGEGPGGSELEVLGRAGRCRARGARRGRPASRLGGAWQWQRLPLRAVQESRLDVGPLPAGRTRAEAEGIGQHRLSAWGRENPCRIQPQSRGEAAGISGQRLDCGSCLCLRPVTQGDFGIRSNGYTSYSTHEFWELGICSNCLLAHGRCCLLS